MWDSAILRATYGYVPGQFDDGRLCASSVQWALCKYDPNNREWKLAISSLIFLTAIIGTKWTPQKFCPTTTTTTTTTTSTTTTTTPTTTTVGFRAHLLVSFARYQLSTALPIPS